MLDKTMKVWYTMFKELGTRLLKKRENPKNESAFILLLLPPKDIIPKKQGLVKPLLIFILANLLGVPLPLPSAGVTHSVPR